MNPRPSPGTATIGAIAGALKLKKTGVTAGRKKVGEEGARTECSTSSADRRQMRSSPTGMGTFGQRTIRIKLALKAPAGSPSPWRIPRRSARRARAARRASRAGLRGPADRTSPWTQPRPTSSQTSSGSNHRATQTWRATRARRATSSRTSSGPNPRAADVTEEGGEDWTHGTTAGGCCG